MPTKNAKLKINGNYINPITIADNIENFETKSTSISGVKPIEINLIGGRWNKCISCGSNGTFNFSYKSDLANDPISIIGSIQTTNAHASNICIYSVFSWEKSNVFQIKIIDHSTHKNIYFKPVINSSIRFIIDTSYLYPFNPEFDIDDDLPATYIMKERGLFINGNRVLNIADYNTLNNKITDLTNRIAALEAK